MRPEDVFERPAVKYAKEAIELVQAVAFALTVTVTVGGLVYVAYANRTGPRERLLIVLTAGALGLLLIGILAGIRIRSRRPVDDYEIVDLRGVLSVKREGDHHRYNCVRTQTIEAKRDDVRLVRIRSHWTGTGTGASVRSHDSDHLLFDGKEPEADGRVYRWLYLREPIARGHRVEVGTEQFFRDEITPMRTYYRESGEELRTQTITVTVRFDLTDEPHPDGVKGVMWRGSRNSKDRRAAGNVPLARIVNTATQTVDYTVSVKRPDRRCAYGLQWQFPQVDVTED